MVRLVRSCLVVAALFAGEASPAFTLERLESRFNDGAYHVMLVALLDASPAAIGSVLKDYEDYPRLDPRIRTSERIGTARGGEVLLRTLLRACEGIFCRDVTRIEWVEEEPDSLTATVVSQGSDVRWGTTHTRWQAYGTGTRVSYEADFQPDFWVPAIIGRRFAARGLRDSTLELFRNIEARARGG
jgi:hypothetical protein